MIEKSSKAKVNGPVLSAPVMPVLCQINMRSILTTRVAVRIPAIENLVSIPANTVYARNLRWFRVLYPLEILLAKD